MLPFESLHEAPIVASSITETDAFMIKWTFICFLLCIVEAHGRARISTMNRSGPKEQVRERAASTAKLKMRLHSVDKMDTEGNTSDGKLEIWKAEIWVGAASVPCLS